MAYKHYELKLSTKIELFPPKAELVLHSVYCTRKEYAKVLAGYRLERDEQVKLAHAPGNSTALINQINHSSSEEKR